MYLKLLRSGRPWLRSYNGGKYIDGGFNEYCATYGIRMEKTIL